MHVLVTGAGGFSGAHMVMALLQRGHRVSACVGSSRGRLPETAEQLGEVEIIAGDLAGTLDLPGGLDAIVHAAARSPAAGVTVDNLVRDNVSATARLVNHANRQDIGVFLYFSSLSVYGRIAVPIVNETTPMVDLDAYGLTKRLGEEMLIGQAERMRSLSIRLPGVIGRGSVRNWLTNVLSAAREGREIAIFNPEAPFNNAAHVDDLARFVCDLLEDDWSGADAVTIGAAGQMKVGEVVRLISEAFGDRSRVRIEPGREPSFLVSSDRARERYSYQPMAIADMLSRFVAENSAL
ncbi:MAG: NAD(P)-dependent oxidoreductase [Betaproteobacteria bacterium]